MTLLGTALVASGLFLWLLGTHLRERRWFDRPDFARHPSFDPAVQWARWLLVLAGLLLAGRERPLIAALLGGTILALWALRVALRSVPWRRRRLRREYEALRRAHPGAEERAILVRLVIGRHPAWGEELAEQIALDYPRFEDLARIVTLMERGFRGFR